MSERPPFARALDVPPRIKRSVYPEPFASRMAKREKSVLGDFFGLANFGVNLTRLAPGGTSSLRHSHTKQDEFIYVVSGSPTLHTDAGRFSLAPGDCVGFPSGTGNAHRFLNETEEEVVYLEVGDRTAGDSVSYPDDDIQGELRDGVWCFSHKDGTPY